MHWNVVPAEMKPARPKGTVRLNPVSQNPGHDRLQFRFQLWKTVAQEQTQIDALGAVVKLALVNGQTRRFGKRFGEAIFNEKVPKIIFHPSAKRVQTSLVAGQRMDLGQCFHDEAGVKMIDKIAYSIDRVIPGTVAVLVFQNKIQIALGNLPVIVIGKNLRSAR